MKEKVIVILGPTATGKSALGLCLAQKLGTQIISGDSMLVYQGFNIGTAKPEAKELEAVPHHLVDIMPPQTSYSAAAFQQQAKLLIRQSNEQGKVPLLVGGTGLYLQALLEGYDFPQTREQPELRQELETLAEQKGNEHLYARLLELSPQSAQNIHPHNRQRLIRALEVALSGEEVSRRKHCGLVYDAQVIGLELERQELYARINRRVEQMFAAGLVAEVKGLLCSGIAKTAPAMQGIGYKEVVAYLDGEIDLEACQSLVALHTRRFAKRQLTWYRRMQYINWQNAKQKDLCDNLYSSLVEWGKVE